MDTFQEELNDAKNDLEKQQLLQKYGFIEPKLTPEEKQEIVNEERGFAHYV